MERPDNKHALRPAGITFHTAQIYGFSRSDTAVRNKNRKHPTDLHGPCNFTNRHEKTSFKQTDKTTFSRYKRNAGFLPDAAEPGK